MKLRIALLSVIIFSTLSYGQSVSLLESYKIPSFSFFKLNLYGQDFLNYLTLNDLDSGSKYENIEMNFGFTENSIFQSPMSTRRTEGTLRMNYNKMKQESSYLTSLRENSVGMVNVNTYNDWYLNNEKGFMVYVNPGFVTAYDFRSKKNSGVYELSIGGGFGRIIWVKNVVQAYIISDELGYNFPDEKLLELAEVIERYNAGEYSAKYKDESEIKFYKDITNITGKSEDESKLRQILSSPVYKTSARSLGWQVKLGINYSYRNIEQSFSFNNFTILGIKEGSAYDLYTSFEYALPLDLSKQITLTASYSKNLDDQALRMPRLNLSAIIYVDHNYHWSSSIQGYFNQASPKDSDNLVNLGVRLQTELVLLNKLSAYAAFNYSKAEYSDWLDINWSPTTFPNSKQESIGFHLGFNYSIF